MQDQKTARIIDLLAGGFFLLWACIGWVAFATNGPLRASLGAQADPGPALVPLIVLVILSAGGAFLVAKGGLRHFRQDSGSGLPALTAHILPIGFALTLGTLVLVLPLAGFLFGGVTFTLIWLWLLSDRHGGVMGWALRLTGAVAITGGIYLIFATLLRVPLPGWPS
jgi:hypothetical protein